MDGGGPPHGLSAEGMKDKVKRPEVGRGGLRRNFTYFGHYSNFGEMEWVGWKGLRVSNCVQIFIMFFAHMTPLG